MATNSSSSFHWYIVKCYAGNEAKVKEALDNRIKAEGLQDVIKETLVSCYKERKKRLSNNGEEKIVEKIKNNYPGYVFVNMKMSDETWLIVRNTPKVTGFLGSSGKGVKPWPISLDEIKKVILAHNRIDNTGLDFKFSLDEIVEITKGAMKGQKGKIFDFNITNKTVTLHVDIFGRITPVEVGLDEITKVE